MTTRSIVAGRRAAGRLAPPPSKSLSNRYLNLALLAGRPLMIERLLAAEDTERFLEALRALGWQVRRDGEEIGLAPGAAPRSAEIWCGASGTMLRFLTATLATLPGRWRLDGTERLRERPLAPLLAALRELGAGIRCLGIEGYAPLEIEGGTLGGGAVRLDAGQSSQFASALAMAATRAGAAIEVTLDDLISAPYLNLTFEAVELFGGRVDSDRDGLIRLRPGLGGLERVRVESDHSSAAYWVAAAAVAGGEVELLDLSPLSRQGDRRFLDVLAEMGVGLEWGSDSLRVVGGRPLEAVDRDLAATPDQVPTLAAVAPFARGVTRIRNVPHLRLKESDRLAAMAAGLERAGAEVVEEPDGLRIPGVWADAAPPCDPVTLSPVDDHRVAMSFAILGLGRPGLSVSDAGVVAKSYPGFWRDFDRCFR